jgi:hypothetical protein
MAASVWRKIMMTRILGGAGLILSLTLLASPAPAKFYWYTMHACQFYPGGGKRTPSEVAACRQQVRAGAVRRLCRDQMRRGPLPCEPGQAAVWTAPR